MQFFTDNAAPRAAVTDFLVDHGADLSPELRAELRDQASSASIADMVVNTGELLYARAADLPIAGKVLAAQLSAFRAANDWHRDQDNTNGRALAIRDAMMREAGEEPLPGVSYADPADDPKPQERFAPQAEAPAAPTA